MRISFIQFPASYFFNYLQCISDEYIYKLEKDWEYDELYKPC